MRPEYVHKLTLIRMWLALIWYAFATDPILRVDRDIVVAYH